MSTVWRTKDGDRIPIHGRSEIHEMLEAAKDYVCQRCLHPKVLHHLDGSRKCNVKLCKCPGYSKMKDPLFEMMSHMPPRERELYQREFGTHEHHEGCGCSTQ